MALSRLAEACDVVMGQSPAGESCNSDGIGLPLLNGPTEYGAHHPTPLQFTTDARKRARVGDILFCVRGSTTGRMNWADQEYAIGRGVAAIRHKSRRDLQPFARAVIEYNLPGLLAQATGSTFPNVSADQLAGLWWPRLPEDEQRAIAHILGTLDDRIEANRRMAATLEEMARALFRAWFVTFDPVRAKTEGSWRRGQTLPGLPASLYDAFPDRLVETEHGEIPNGWRWKPLPEIFEVNPSRALRAGEDAAYVEMASVPTKGHRPESLARRPFGSGMKFRNGDTLIARITPCLENGKTAFVDFLADGEAGWGSTEFIVLSPRAPWPKAAGYLLARDERFREFAIQSMTGTSGRQRVPASALDHFVFPAPGESVLEALGRFVQPWLKRSSAAIAENSALAALRDALLPKFVSGAIRVRDAEAFLKARGL